MHDEHLARPPAVRDRYELLLEDDERGAQAAEYAMLGGVGAAACATLVALLRNSDLLERIVRAIVEAIVVFLGGWFAGG